MNSNQQLRIVFVGDVALNGGYHSLVHEDGGRSFVASVRSLVAGSDIVIGNLEGPLTDCASAGPPWRFTLHGAPPYGSLLRKAGFDVLTLANNHAMDHGEAGLQETIGIVDCAGIRFGGAGRNLAEARRPIQFEAKGIRIAVISYCDVSTLSPLYATDDKAGVPPLKRSFIFDDIAAIRPACDVLIACMHWGQENVTEPAPKYRRIAREMIAAGVNIVVGHHPHVLQGAERIEKGAVAYSLGNFTFSDEDWHGTNQNGESFSMPYRLSEENRRSVVWNVVVNSGGAVLEENYSPVYLSPDLLPTRDARPERQVELVRRNSSLRMWPYRLRWAGRMVRCRSLVLLHSIRGEDGLRTRLLRLRPRHIRDLSRMLIREWQQFRGTE